MNVRDPWKTPSSSPQQIKNYTWKFYYKRFLEVILSVLIYKSIVYSVYRKVVCWFVDNDDSIFYKVIHEYLVSMLLLHSISSELFSQVEYKKTHVKHIFIGSVRILLLCYDSNLVSDCFGLTDVSNNTRRTCVYFFPAGHFCFTEIQVCVWISNVVLSVLFFLKFSPLSKSGQLFPLISFTETQEVLRFNHWVFGKIRKLDLFYPAFISVIIHYFLGNALRKIFEGHFPSSQDISIIMFLDIRLWITLICNIFIVSYSFDMMFYFNTVIFTKPFDFFFNFNVKNACYKYPLVDGLRSDLFLVQYLAYQNIHKIALFDSERKAIVYRMIHIQDDRPLIWKTVLTEFFHQLNGFTHHVLFLHVRDLKPFWHLRQPHPILHCADIESYLKHINEYRVLILVVLTITELSCESIKYHPPSIVNKDIHDVISKLFSFNKRLRHDSVLTTHSWFVKISRCYHLNRYLRNKSFEETNEIYKSVKEVCETQLRKMLSVLRGYISMVRFSSSVQRELERFMEFDTI